MEPQTLGDILQKGTPRPRKDGTLTTQIYTTSGFTHKLVGRAVKMGNGFIGTKFKEFVLMLIEGKEQKALEKSQCRKCIHLVRNSCSSIIAGQKENRVVFVTPARVYSKIEDGMRIRYLLPVKGERATHTLCSQGIPVSEDGTISPGLLPNTYVVPINTKECIHGSLLDKKGR